MDYLRALNDPDINSVLNSANDLAKNLKSIEEEGFIKKNQILDSAAQTCRDFMNNKTSAEIYDGPVATCLKELRDMILYNLKNNMSSIVMIPLSLEVMKANNDEYTTLTDYLAEGIALNIAERKGLEIETLDEENDSPLDDINQLIRESEEYVGRQDYENAVACLNRLIDILQNNLKNYNNTVFPSLSKVYNNLAYYLFCLNHLQEALQAVDKGLAEDKALAILHYTKAEILDGLGQFEAAVSCMDEAIRLEDSPDKHVFRKSIKAKRLN